MWPQFGKEKTLQIAVGAFLVALGIKYKMTPKMTTT